MRENWKNIKGYEGTYQISSTGNFRSLDRVMPNGRFYKGKNISPYLTNSGYHMVDLFFLGSKTKAYVHRLVAQAFIPNPMKLPCTNHIDGNKLNNSTDNLEWCTRSHNQRHALKSGLNSSLGCTHYRSRLTPTDVQKIRRLGREGVITHAEIGEMYGMAQGRISAIIRRDAYKNVPMKHEIT